VEASYIISAAHSSFPKGTVHLIGVDMELNKETNILLQWNDSYLLPLITAFLVCCKKIVPQRMVAINIHDRLSSEATGLDVFFSGLSYRKGWITKRH
jgi:hypothetical protein